MWELELFQALGLVKELRMTIQQRNQGPLRRLSSNDLENMEKVSSQSYYI